MAASVAVEVGVGVGDEATGAQATTKIIATTKRLT
jgi:hypothetical protein